MQVQIDAGVIGLFLTVLLAWSGFMVGSVKWLLDRYQNHIDRRFNALEQHTALDSQQWQRVERELNQLKATLPVEYVRREDWVRFATVIDTKIDRMSEVVLTLKEALNVRSN